MKREELIFDNLYEKCIQEWPESLNLELKSEISQTVEAHPDGYQLIKCKYGEWDGSEKNYIVYQNNKQLSDIEEKIEESFLDHEQEILLIYINEAISIVIGKLAFYKKKIDLIDIRNQSVKNNFEARVKRVFDKDFDCEKSDIDLVHEYFCVNYPNQEI